MIKQQYSLFVDFVHLQSCDCNIDDTTLRRAEFQAKFNTTGKMFIEKKESYLNRLLFGTKWLATEDIILEKLTPMFMNNKTAWQLYVVCDEVSGASSDSLIRWSNDLRKLMRDISYIEYIPWNRSDKDK